MATAKTIYEKLADARAAFHELELKKTGRNKFAGYDYFELGDFLIPALKCLHDEGLVPLPVIFKRKKAIMVLKEFSGDGEIRFESPMIEAEYIQESDNGSLKMYSGAKLKGCHPIQNLGAVETYQRRYLWVALMEIVEHDALDATTGSDDKTAKKVTKKAPAKKAPARRTATPPDQDNADPPDFDDDDDDDFNDEINIENETDAIVAADTMINLAKGMHSNSLKNLTSFWKKNVELLNILGDEYPDHYERVKSAFAILKKRIKKAEEEDEE